MIIFGTRGVTYTKQQGEFQCPQCNAPSPYKQKRVRRFFTLYFIPVIPMDLLGEYVECPACRGTYNTGVLQWNPDDAAAEFEAEFHRGLKRVMIEMLLADGVVDDNEVTMACKLYEQVAGRQTSESTFRAEIESVQADGQSVTEFLTALAPALNESGKETIMKGAILVSAADGAFQPEEQLLIAEWADALGMTEAHMSGLVAQFNSMAQSA